MGYYRPSGYSYACRELVDGVRTERFLEGTILAQVLALYDVDRRLKLSTLDAMKRMRSRSVPRSVSFWGCAGATPIWTRPTRTASSPPLRPPALSPRRLRPHDQLHPYTRIRADRGRHGEYGSR
ncbi:Abi family protein [Kineococcus sp. NBC_00420]|uniref:Abi family protein n=1 Tax=Kineococcus sp. NBC_00420 TaxID=2903564 RepID=UPI003FA58949